MQISGIFNSFFGLSLYSRQAAKCSRIVPPGTGIHGGSAGIRRGGAGICRGGAGIQRPGYPPRRIPAPPLRIPAPPLRIPAPPLHVFAPRWLQIPVPGGTILDNLAACLD